MSTVTPNPRRWAVAPRTCSAGIGVAFALLLLGGPRKTPQEHREPVMATGAAE